MTKTGKRTKDIDSMLVSKVRNVIYVSCPHLYLCKGYFEHFSKIKGKKNKLFLILKDQMLHRSVNKSYEGHVYQTSVEENMLGQVQESYRSVRSVHEVYSVHFSVPTLAAILSISERKE